MASSDWVYVEVFAMVHNNLYSSYKYIFIVFTNNIINIITLIIGFYFITRMILNYRKFE